MADFVKGLFGGDKDKAAPVGDNDFADFAGAPDPSPASITPSVAAAGSAAKSTAAPVVYTKWYRVWERASPSDFKQEAYLLPFVILLVLIHTWGRKKNRRIANTWAKAHAPALQKEFASVGFSGRPNPTIEEVSESGLLQASTAEKSVEILKEKSGNEFTSYATGRQNIAFVDIKLETWKRYNPFLLFIEWLLSATFGSYKGPTERVEATSYAFDGREKDLVPVASQAGQDELETRVKGLNSGYDGFIWAIVHKNHMRKMRDERYDLSLTFTRENDKLPLWATVMSESAEVTNTLLTQDLVKAVEQAGDERFEYLVVSDQPLDKPTKIQETVPRKRISLGLSLPSGNDPKDHIPTLPLFSYFLRLPDQLASGAHFRPEVLKKIKQAREQEIQKLQRADETEKAEERKIEADKKKKEIRDAKLRTMSPEDQRKYLDKEREKDQRKMGKRQQAKA